MGQGVLQSNGKVMQPKFISYLPMKQRNVRD
jgi:hypothetical protein